MTEVTKSRCLRASEKVVLTESTFPWGPLYLSRRCHWTFARRSLPQHPGQPLVLPRLQDRKSDARRGTENTQRVAEPALPTAGLGARFPFTFKFKKFACLLFSHQLLNRNSIWTIFYMFLRSFYYKRDIRENSENSKNRISKMKENTSPQELSVVCRCISV